uniref:Uncharacterized protein n=1 Tax=Alexandrium catenella TaxID=2925 RepID=A0A7S1PMB4_ALECA|mmetsp:Transcript_104014/g.276768  ORF Transcript_104014/g.276768 Transcript_104014/m.276768 type:complete len:188 (+) Transcript_104014:1-564(+)
MAAPGDAPTPLLQLGPLRPLPGRPLAVPDPAAVSRQKDVYLKMLDEQLRQGVIVLDQQVKYQKDYLEVQCEQQKKHFLLQLDQQRRSQEMALGQQYNEQLMSLQMQAGAQKAAVEQQAMQLAMEYEQRKAEEEMYRQQHEIQQQQRGLAVKLVTVPRPDLAVSFRRPALAASPPMYSAWPSGSHIRW